MLEAHVAARSADPTRVIKRSASRGAIGCLERIGRTDRVAWPRYQRRAASAPACQRQLKMGHDHRVKMGQVAGTEP
jgi:hypothetical protein